MEEKVFVVSLPRTGTTTMCNMLNILGYKAKHTPSCFYDKWVNEGYNAFADTPCYVPSLVKELTFNPNNKFIYIHRMVEDWMHSFEGIKMPDNYERMMKIDERKNINVVILNDIKSYGEVFGYHSKFNRNTFMIKYLEHRDNIKNIFTNSDKCLFYDLKDGWEPLCKFLNKELPTVDVPILNKNKMGDSYSISC